MLGVRREGVREGALELQKAGLIRYTRGHITVVLDRQGLEQRSCECYAVVKKEYDRLFPERTGNECRHYNVCVENSADGRRSGAGQVAGNSCNTHFFVSKTRTTLPGAYCAIP